MGDSRSERKDVTTLRSFWTFTSHFVHYCYVLRGLLGAQVLLVLIGGVLFARLEDIAVSQGIYFSFVTATTVGFGDITPSTGMGQVISVAIAFVGTVHFGLVIAVATQAFTVTIREYMDAHGNQSSATAKS